MGYLTRKLESLLLRDRTAFYGDTARAYSDLENNELYKLVQEIRKLASEREQRVKDYTEMLTDGITLSAVDLITEDSTQYNEEHGATVWIESSDKNFEKKANDFLQKKMDIERQAYAIVFNIVTYGECYLNTFYSDEGFRDSGSKVGDYFEIEAPENVAHVYKFGKPSGYYVQNDNNFSSRTIKDKLLTEKDFIHFISDKGMNREKIKLEVLPKEGGEREEKEYTIHYGSSFLEAARTYFRTKILLDNILVLSRLSRSQFYRLFGIEVGNSDTIETDRIIKEVKDAVSTQRGFDKTGERLTTVAAPMSTGGNVYIPVRNGKGSIKVDTTGGDTDVRAMLDVDYFDNQYYGALKVPKQFLGQAEDMPGGLGDTTLTRLDIRYARTCKRVQTVFREGVKDAIYWWGAETDTAIPEFKVCMSKISTAEDDEQARVEAVRVDKANSILDMIDRFQQEEIITSDMVRKLLRFLIEEVYGDKQLAEIILGKKNDVKNE